jgi:hypothetical protein
MGTLEQELRGSAAAGRGWYAVLARAGLVAKGFSYCLVGALAVKLAVGAGGRATSRQGALETLAHHGFGRVVLAALVAGFAAYALWRFVQAYAEKPAREDSAAKAWGKRAGYAARGVVYAGLTYSTLRLLFGGRGQSQDAKAHHSTAVVLSWPGGTWLVGAAGLALLGAALWNLYRGVSRKFEDRWRLSELSPALRTWGSRAGLVGHVARFVVFGLIGVFVIKAAVDYSPQDAIGLDGALEKLARGPYGPWLLGLTAAGLVAYGVFCFFDARLRDVSI